MFKEWIQDNVYRIIPCVVMAALVIGAILAFTDNSTFHDIVEAGGGRRK